MRRKYIRSIAAVVAVSVVTLGLGGLGGSAGAKPASGEPIKFGYISTLAGASSNPVQLQAIQAYVDDWNKRGGHNGQPIQVVGVIPETTAPEGYVSEFNRMVEDEGVVGFIDPGACRAVTPLLQANPQIGAWGQSDQCNGIPNLFATAGTAPTLPMLKYAIDNGSKVFAVAYPSAVPQLKTGFVDPLVSYLELNPDIDIELVDVGMPFPATAADWDAAIQKMKSANVDTLFMANTPEGTPLGLQEAAAQGFAPADGITWIFGPNLYVPEVAENPVFEGTYALATQIPWEDTKDPQIKKMKKVTKGKIDIQDGFAAAGYAQAALLEASIKPIKGEVTPESVLAQWKKTTKIPAPLTTYKLNFTDYTKNPSGGQIVKFENGAFVNASEYITIPPKEFIQ